MSATIGTVERKQANIVCLSGQNVHLEDYRLGEHKEYVEYHKREVFLLKYFFELLGPILLTPSPDQFQLFECYPVSKDNLILYPYRIEFRNVGTDLFMWIILVPDSSGKLFVFAMTKPCVQNGNSKNIDNPDLIWEKF